MFSRNWETSAREHDVVVDDIAIPVAGGVRLRGLVFRPRNGDSYPVLLAAHPYNNELQFAPINPVGYESTRGWIEAGDPHFYARRGYIYVAVNVRGTGASDGQFQALGTREIEDVAEAVEWIGSQQWCNGRVGMLGASYFAWVQQKVAMLAPSSLAAIFPMYGASDFYRDVFYHGGILSHRFLAQWVHKLDGLRYESWYASRYGDEAFEKARMAALDDEELGAVPAVREALLDPSGPRALMADIAIQPLDSEFYRERSLDYASPGVPAHFVGDWGQYGMHLPGALRGFDRWGAAKSLTIGPPLYLDRPMYQYQYESLKWFDHFLKGSDNGIDRRLASGQVFLPRVGEWKDVSSWPPEEAVWTPFFLHDRGVLSEREPLPLSGQTTFEESPFGHESAVWASPLFVERTEIVGPAVLHLRVSTTDADCLLFVSLQVGAPGEEEEITRGWLRATQREVDHSKSTPWDPHHAHRRRVPLVPGEIYDLQVGLVGTAAVVEPGQRVVLCVKGADDETPPDTVRAVAYGHVSRQSAARICIYHNPDQPSILYLPVTKGNVVGTYLSGGILKETSGRVPVEKIARPKYGIEAGGSTGRSLASLAEDL